MDQHQLKRQVAQAALAFVEPGRVLGVGTGSTVDLFIEALATSGIPLAGAVS
jgi:ribose 5-phosphate isomerase A